MVPNVSLVQQIPRNDSRWQQMTRNWQSEEKFMTEQGSWYFGISIIGVRIKPELLLQAEKKRHMPKRVIKQMRQGSKSRWVKLKAVGVLKILESFEEEIILKYND
jgi:hypothetical protein